MPVREVRLQHYQRSEEIIAVPVQTHVVLFPFADNSYSRICAGLEKVLDLKRYLCVKYLDQCENSLV